MADDDDVASRTVCVRGIQPETHDDDLLFFFESRRNKGGDIDVLNRIENRRAALITFADASVAKDMVARSTVKYDGKTEYSVSWPSTTTWGAAEEKLNNVTDCENSNQIVVRGEKLPSQEVLSLYFENKRLSGGGDISHIADGTGDDRAVTITFENAEDAYAVLQRKHIVDGCVLQVQAVEDESYLTALEPRAVKVTNVPAGCTRDHLTYFFESRRNDGGDVSTVHYNKDTGIAVVTFSEDGIARRLASKMQLTINNRQVLCSLLRHPPPPRLVLSERTDTKKLLLSYLPDDFTDKELVHYLETTCNLRSAQSAVQSITRCPDSTKAVVAFDEDPDYKQLRKLTYTIPFKDTLIGVQKMELTATIIVFPVENISEDNLFLYFESKRIGGGEIESNGIQIHDRYDYAIITFMDCSVVDSVVKKPHTFAGHTMTVRAYWDCIGPPSEALQSRRQTAAVPDVVIQKPAPSVATEATSVKIPDDIEFPCELFAAKFLVSNVELKNLIERDLAPHHCLVKWPASASEASVVILHCSLRPDEVGDLHCLEKWTETCSGIYKQHYSVIGSGSLDVPAELWKELVEELESFNLHDEDLLLDFDESRHKIAWVGINKRASYFGRVAGDKMQSLMNKVEKTTDETVHLKPHQFELLNMCKFVDNAKSKCASSKIQLTVALDQSKITLSGLSSDVDHIKTFLDQLLSGFRSSPALRWSECKLNVLKKQSVKDHFKRSISAKSIRAVVEIDAAGVVHVHAASEKELSRVLDLIESNIEENVLPLDESMLLSLFSDEWEVFKSTVDDQYPSCCVNVSDSNDSLIIAGLTDEVPNVLLAIQELLESYVKVEARPNLDVDKSLFIEKFAQDEISTISREFKGQVDVTIRGGEVFVRGGQREVAKVIDRLKELLDSVREFCYEPTLPGTVKYFTGTRGNLTLDALQNKHKVIVKLKEREIQNSNDRSNRAAQSEGSTSVTKVTVQYHEVRIAIIKGDITKHRCDVIVNSSNEYLELGEGVCKAIMTAAGDSVQKECRAYVQRNGKVLVSNNCETIPGNLNCQHILHVVGPKWCGGNNGEDVHLAETIDKVLKWAHLKKAKTLALPAIGVGYQKHPAAAATEIMLKAVRDFIDDIRSPDVKPSFQQIAFVDMSDSVANHFHESAVKVFGKTCLQTPSVARSVSSPTLPIPAVQPKPSSYIAVDAVTVKTKESIAVKLCSGSLTDQQVDAIVNIVSGDCDLSMGRLSKALSDKAGPGMQDECKKLLLGKNLQQGEFISTRGFNLPCKAVVHVCLHRWDDGKGQVEQSTRTFVRTCLEKCDGLKSIAFPALGTGNLGYPPHEVAKIMYEEVEKFSKSTKTSVRDVMFVIYDKAVLQKFKDYINALTCAPNATPPPQAPRRRRNVKDFAKNKNSASPAAQQHRAEQHTAAATTATASGPVFDWSGNFVMIGKLRFEIKGGADITKENTDAVVNSTNDRLDLTQGAVSKAMVKAGGQDFVDDCKKQKCTVNGVAVTAAGKMPSKYVIHLAAPEMSDKWKSVILKGLNEAESRKLQSIAFPLLGTGQRDVAVSDIADDFFGAVSELGLKVKYLKTVRVCIFEAPMAQAFIKAISARCSSAASGTSTTTATSPPGAQRNRQPVDPDHDVNTNKKHVLCFYATSQQNIDDAINEIEQLANEGTSDVVIENDFIKTLSDDQIMRIADRCDKAKVAFTIDKGRHISRIRLRGEKSDVMRMEQMVMDIRKESDMERQRKMEEELIATTVCWEYEEGAGGSYQQYPAAINAIIERARLQRLPTVEWEEDDDVKFQIDFNAMTESNLTNSSPKVKVRRTPIVIKLPDHWERMPDNERFRKVQLTVGSPEFTAVEKNVEKTAQGTVHEIIRIYRIQNPYLYRQYQVRKTELEPTDSTNFPLERILWHGTSVETTEQINSGGFNRSYCGKNATMYGQGVYFASEWTYSARETYSRPDTSGYKYIYQVRALTGEYVVGKKDMKEPPMKPTSPGQQYTSCVDQQNNPEIFVIFHDAGAYPEYLIVFVPKKQPTTVD